MNNKNIEKLLTPIYNVENNNNNMYNFFIKIILYV